MANLVPVGQLTMAQAHQEFTKLVDQILAKFVQLDSGEFRAVGTPAFDAKMHELAVLFAHIEPTMPKAQFIHSGSFTSTTFLQALSGLFQLNFLLIMVFVKRVALYLRMLQGC